MVRQLLSFACHGMCCDVFCVSSSGETDRSSGETWQAHSIMRWVNGNAIDWTSWTTYREWLDDVDSLENELDRDRDRVIFPCNSSPISMERETKTSSFATVAAEIRRVWLLAMAVWYSLHWKLIYPSQSAFDHIFHVCVTLLYACTLYREHITVPLLRRIGARAGLFTMTHVNVLVWAFYTHALKKSIIDEKFLHTIPTDFALWR